MNVEALPWIHPSFPPTSENQKNLRMTLAAALEQPPPPPPGRCFFEDLCLTDQRTAGRPLSGRGQSRSVAQHSASFSINHQFLSFLPRRSGLPLLSAALQGSSPSAPPRSDLIVQLRMTCFHLQRPPGSAHLTLTDDLCTGRKAAALVFLLGLNCSDLSFFFFFFYFCLN